MGDFTCKVFLFFVRVVIIHLNSLAAGHAQRDLFHSLNDGHDIFLPLRPITLEESSDVIGLLFRVLQIQVSRLLGALIRIPGRRYAPRFSALAELRGSHDTQGQVDTSALAALEKAIMLEIDFQGVRDLENLSHPTRAERIVLTLWLFVIVVEVGESFAALINIHDRY